MKVRITELLTKIVDVEATNEEEALDTVIKMYDNEEIILNSDDFLDVDFSIEEKD